MLCHVSVIVRYGRFVPTLCTIFYLQDVYGTLEKRSYIYAKLHGIAFQKAVMFLFALRHVSSDSSQCAKPWAG